MQFLHDDEEIGKPHSTGLFCRLVYCSAAARISALIIQKIVLPIFNMTRHAILEIALRLFDGWLLVL